MMRNESTALIIMGFFAISALSLLFNSSAGFLYYVAVASLILFFGRIFYLYYIEKKHEEADEVFDVQDIELGDVKDWVLKNHKGHLETVSIILSDLEDRITINHPSRPLGTYLLVGPTGTGKTYLANLLASSIYEDDEPIYFDMTQYKNGDDSAELIEELVKEMRHDPNRLILFDEIDKCSSDVREGIFQVLDNGTLRDKATGLDISFKSSIIMATSNAGAQQLEDLYEKKDGKVSRSQRLQALGNIGLFSKPFLARWDHIFYMPMPKRDDLCEIAILEFIKYWKNLGIKLVFVEPELIVEAIIRNNDYSEYGIREFQRVIQDLLHDSLKKAKEKGFTEVTLQYKNGKIVPTGKKKKRNKDVA